MLPMARNNRVSVQGDLTGDIHYDVIQKDGRVIPFLRVYMMINNSSTAGEVRGLRVMFYGLLAEEAEAHLQKGSRIEVEGHLQIRRIPDEGISVEVAAEDVDYIRNITWERGAKRLAEMAAVGKKRPRLDPVEDYYPVSLPVDAQP
jgi:single-stranded DNA-binding protein